MALVTTTEMFKKAYDGGYAVGAFNVNNMEIVQGITEAAGELNSPVILQVSKGARAYANHKYLVKMVEAAVEELTEGVDVAYVPPLLVVTGVVVEPPDVTLPVVGAADPVLLSPPLLLLLLLLLLLST